jgi:hypothetical protein
MELSTTREISLVVSALDSFPAFYGTRRFNTECTRALHLSLSWASPFKSTSPHPTSTRSILILYNHLRLGLPSVLFPSGFPTNNIYACHFCGLLIFTRILLHLPPEAERYHSHDPQLRGRRLCLPRQLAAEIQATSSQNECQGIAWCSLSRHPGVAWCDNWRQWIRKDVEGAVMI